MPRSVRVLIIVAAATLSSLVITYGGNRQSSAAESSAAETSTIPGTDVTVAASDASFEAEWADLIAAAQEEGGISFLAGPEGAEQDGDYYQAFADEFGLEMSLFGGPTDEVTARVLAERDQGIYSYDVASLGGSGTANLLEAGVLAPVRPLLFHPEALDRSTGWHLDYIPWLDENEELCTFIAIESEGNLMPLWYNTETVTQEEIDSLQSWDDLLDPRWRGRIVIGDIASGEASQDVTVVWTTLGQDWLDTLLRDMDADIVQYGSAREQAEGLARGDWDIALFSPGEAALEAAQEDGLPVAPLERTLAEGNPRSPIQRLCVMQDAAHPNAAKLFANWSLTVDGQTAFNEYIHRPGRASLRNDVPQGNIDDATWERAFDEELGNRDENTDEWRTAQEESRAFVEAVFDELNLVPGG